MIIIKKLYRSFGAIPRPMALMTSGNFMALIGSYDLVRPKQLPHHQIQNRCGILSADAFRRAFAVEPFEPIGQQSSLEYVAAPVACVDASCHTFSISLLNQGNKETNANQCNQ